MPNTKNCSLAELDSAAQAAVSQRSHIRMMTIKTMFLGIIPDQVVAICKSHPKIVFASISASELKSQSSKKYVQYSSGCLFASSLTLGHIPYLGMACNVPALDSPSPGRSKTIISGLKNHPPRRVMNPRPGAFERRGAWHEKDHRPAGYHYWRVVHRLAGLYVFARRACV